MNKTGRVHLQKRDISFLEMCCHFGFLTVKHFSKWIYKNTELNARRRLRMLHGAGFLKFGTRRERAGVVKVYIPHLENLRGAIEDGVVERGHLAVQTRPWFNSVCNHEDIVRHWAIRLQLAYLDADVDLEFMYFKSLGGTKMNRPLARNTYPDITLRRWQKTEIAFEVELTLKSSKRYSLKLVDLMSTPGRPTVYLVQDPTVLRAIQKQIENAQQTLRRRNQQALSNVFVVPFDEIDTDGDLRKLIERIDAS